MSGDRKQKERPAQTECSQRRQQKECHFLLFPSSLSIEYFFFGLHAFPVENHSGDRQNSHSGDSQIEHDRQNGLSLLNARKINPFLFFLDTRVLTSTIDSSDFPSIFVKPLFCGFPKASRPFFLSLNQ
ncbi:hypothetical protein KP509_37G063900 [Ceratopteris richardii]|uniref:Uncharacterized protein n=1 Tax=Ceratopteris richardii TaxID=49495 RepID=A0A8T2Q9T3_CERRI|nr:hypothetical protein KP509_37G063900 [Ceratopteris richardii]